MWNQKTVLIGRGKAGWHSTSVGETSPEGDRYTTTGSSSGGTLETYLKEAPEGCPIYDASECDYATFSSWVFKGPMVKATLGKGEVSRFSKEGKETLLGMLPGLSGGFDTLAVLALSDLSSLDYVSVDVYLQLLQERCPRVKVGKVYGGQIVWDQ